MNKVYLFIVTTILLFFGSSPQEVDIRRIGGAIGRILAQLDSMDPSKHCSNNTSCRKSEMCILQVCRNPCRTECGANAVCNVVDHEPHCRCPKCYEGDALVECTPYKGLKKWVCLWDKLIKTFNTSIARTPEGV